MKKIIILALFLLLANTAVKQEPKAFAVETQDEPVLKANVYQEEVYTTTNSIIPVYNLPIKEEVIPVEIEKVDKNIEVGEFYDCLIKCESGYNISAVGDHGKSRGILQFQKPTFNRFCVEIYGIAKEIDWLDPLKQIECCKKMVEDGLEEHWTCAKKCR